MEALGVAKNRNNAWNSDKGSPLLDSLKQRSAYSGVDSPLATQLQQAWLQTQLPKRNIPKLDFLSPYSSPDYLVRNSSPDYYQQQVHTPARSSSTFSQPSPPAFSSADSYQQEVYGPARSSSSTFSQPSPRAVSPGDSNSESPYNSHSDVSSVSPHVENDFGSEPEPMEEDHMLQYLSDMLMDEDLSEKKCMYVQCSAYQAMTKELSELIGDVGPPSDFYSSASGGGYEEKDAAVNSWIDEVLSSNPQDFLHEQGSPQSVNLDDEVSYIAHGITNITTDSTPQGSGPGISNVKTDGTSHGPGPGPVSAAAAVRSVDCAAINLEVDCPYLENDGFVDGTDYTNGRSGIESLVELYPLLMQCAQAVAADDVREAHQLINQLRQQSSPFGDGGQRLTYYILEALVARLSGTGAQLYTALSSNRPSAREMIKAYRLFVQCNPLPKVSHMFANATIYNAVKDSDRIHIVDFGILYGVQWPCLLRRLALRPGGPPHVRITGIDFAQPGFQKNDRVEETGRRLAEQAKQVGVEFEYHAIAGKWETIQPAQLMLRNDETLIVNSMYRLRNLLDETVMASSPRKAVLAKIHSLNPKIFTMGVISAGYNSPFFMARFRETINHFSALFDAIHTSVPPDADLRRLAEKEVLGREILNVIACEGTERIERAETYRQWQSRSVNAGFKQLPVDPEIIAKAHDILKRYHRNYGIAQDGNWLLTGWRDRVLHGLTAWAPA